MFATGGNTHLHSGFPVNSGTPYLYGLVVHEATNRVVMYLNGSIVSNQSFSGSAYYGNLFIGTYQVVKTSASYDWVGQIDSVMVFDDSLTNQEMLDIYNNGVFLDCPFGLELDLYTSLINNTENFNDIWLNFTFNGSFSSTPSTDLVNVSIFVQNKLNDTLYNINISKNTKYNLSLSTVEYPLNLSFNVSNNEVSTESGMYYYNVDVFSPRVNISLTNNSIFTYADTLTINISGYDPNLFAYNISILDENETELENYFAENLTGTTFINETSRQLTQNGNFTLKVYAWDSHTKKEIKDYKINKLDNGFEFEDKIKITSQDLKSNEHKTIKKKDKYEFEFDFVKNKNFVVINLESTDNLYYIEDSNYNAHFVDFINKKWIDFNSPLIEDYTIKKIDSKHYEITLKKDKNTDKILFKSIGDLNEFKEFYYYEVLPQVPVVEEPLNLTGVESAINNLGNSIIMISLIILIILFVVMGLIMRYYWLWIFPSLLCLMFVFYYSSLNWSAFNFLMMWIYIILSTTFFILSIIFSILKRYKDNTELKKSSEEMFYKEY